MLNHFSTPNGVRIRLPYVMVCIVSLLGWVQTAQADTYPDKSIQLVIGFGQGGPTDVVARFLAEEMSGLLKQKVFVENRPGASGNIATQTVANAAPDGYSYLIGALPLAVNHSRFPDFPVQFGRNIRAIAAIGATNNVLVVHPSIKATSVAEFAALAKADSGSISCGTFGKGSSSHLAAAEFQTRANVQLVEVPYKRNSDTVNDIIGGHISCWFAPVPSVAALTEAGKLRALAVTGPERVDAFPGVPTFSELGFEGFDVRLWVGLFARSDVAENRLQVIETAAREALASTAMQLAFEKQGIEPMSMGSAEFTTFVEDEISRWEEIGSQLKSPN